MLSWFSYEVFPNQKILFVNPGTTFVIALEDGRSLSPCCCPDRLSHCWPDADDLRRSLAALDMPRSRCILLPINNNLDATQPGGSHWYVVGPAALAPAELGSGEAQELVGGLRRHWHVLPLRLPESVQRVLCTLRRPELEHSHPALWFVRSSMQDVSTSRRIDVVRLTHCLAVGGRLRFAEVPCPRAVRARFTTRLPTSSRVLQENSYDCGVFVIEVAEQLARFRSDSKDGDMRDFSPVLHGNSLHNRRLWLKNLISRVRD